MLGLLRLRCHDLDFGVIANGREKTASAIGMTGRPGLIDQNEQAVTVAIDPEIDKFLDMPRAFPLDPERLT